MTLSQGIKTVDTFVIMATTPAYVTVTSSITVFGTIVIPISTGVPPGLSLINISNPFKKVYKGQEKMERVQQTINF